MVSRILKFDTKTRKKRIQFSLNLLNSIFVANNAFSQAPYQLKLLKKKIGGESKNYVVKNI